MSLTHPTLQTAAWALVHFLWQGCALWLLTAVALRLARPYGPKVRYLIACVGLASCLAMPVATFLQIRPAVLSQTGDLAMRVPVAAPRPKGQVTPRPLQRAKALQRAQALPRQVGALLESHLVTLLQCWLVGILFLALRFGGGWLVLNRLQRAIAPCPQELQARFAGLARRLGHGGPVRWAVSARITSPMVVGWLRPMVLLPVGLLTAMDPLRVEVLLVHELAHIRRHDYLVNILQCCVEILLFYHPAVWWVSRQVRIERELCCDDMAVAWCSDPLFYAETLTRLQALRPETLAPALAAHGGDLMFRIKRLLLPPLGPGTLLARLNLAALGCSLLLIFGTGLSLKAMQARQADDAKWFLAGSSRKDYALALDAVTTHGGKPSQTLSAIAAKPEGFATVMQDCAATNYLGKRVRMSAWVKTAKLEGWAGLWLRVDGPAGATLAFDNMGQRPIKGTTDWQRYEVVLDVADQARNLAFGLLQDGPGQAWLSDLQLEIVDAGVAVTHTAGGPAHSLPPDLTAEGWFLAGSAPSHYETRVDPKVLHEGKPTRLFASKADQAEGFGTLMQWFKGQAYLGRRVRLSAWIKVENLEDWAGLWLRVDGPDGKVTAFDNMHNRQIRGTQDWQRCQVVLDVAPDSTALALGVILSGKGKAWMTQPELEQVDATVPVTDMKIVPAK